MHIHCDRMRTGLRNTVTKEDYELKEVLRPLV